MKPMMEYSLALANSSKFMCSYWWKPPGCKATVFIDEMSEGEKHVKF